MNSKTHKTASVFGLSVMAIALIAFTTQAQAGQKLSKKATRITDVTKDQFQLTLSNVPYSANADAAYVRNACKIAKKKKKPSS